MIILLILFTFTTSALSNSCIEPTDTLIDLDIINRCNKNSDGIIEKYCGCDLFQLNEKENEKSTIKAHDTFIAIEYKKQVNKALLSISSDLNVLGNDHSMSPTARESLKKSCNIENNLKDALKTCSKNENSYLARLSNSSGNDLVDELIDGLGTELDFRQKNHINTPVSNGGSCSPKKRTGLVDRCSSIYSADCNMSDNLADQVFMKASMKKLTRALIKIAQTKEQNTKLSDDLATEAFTADFSLPDSKSSASSLLEEIRKNAYLNELSIDPKNIDFINKMLETIPKSITGEGIKVGSDEYSQLFKLVEKQIKDNKAEEIIKKCNDVYTATKDFFCADTAQNPKESFTALEPEDFMKVISEHSDIAFGASKYYCEETTKNLTRSPDAFKFKEISGLLYGSERSSASVGDMASSSYADQSHKMRQMLCSDVYGPIYKAAKKRGLKVDNAITPEDRFALYDFQSKEYGRILAKDCIDLPEPKSHCDYTASLAELAQEELKLAKDDILEEDKKKAYAKETNGKYIPTDYSKVKKRSLAQMVLLDEETVAISPKEKVITTKSDDAIKEDKAKLKSAPVKSSGKVTYKAITEEPKPQTNNTEEIINTSANTNTGLTLNASASDKYWNKKSEDLNKDIAAAKEKIAGMSYEEVNKKQEEYKAKINDEIVSQLSSALTPNDFIEEQRFINKHTMQDEGRSPASTKIATPSTYELRSRQNKILNETINNKYLASDDSIEVDNFFTGNSNLINKHGLTDSNGNVIPLIEVRIKGSIEEDFTKVLEKDEDKLITKDRKMILSDPNQFKEFKVLAKALEQKKTFLISRHDNEDIKLIVKYNNQLSEYTVEPFADKERLSLYAKDYLLFQKNISNAIKDKTFKTLMKKYK